MSFIVVANRRISSSDAGSPTRRSRSLTLISATSLRSSSTSRSERPTSRRCRRCGEAGEHHAADERATTTRSGRSDSTSASVVPTVIVAVPAGDWTSVVRTRTSTPPMVDLVDPAVRRARLRRLGVAGELGVDGIQHACVGGGGDGAVAETDAGHRAAVVGDRDRARGDAGLDERAQIGRPQVETGVDVVDQRRAQQRDRRPRRRRTGRRRTRKSAASAARPRIERGQSGRRRVVRAAGGGASVGPAHRPSSRMRYPAPRTVWIVLRSKG